MISVLGNIGKGEGTTLGFRRWLTCYCQISRSHRYPGPQWLCSCHALWCRSSSPQWHRWCVWQSSRRDARKWPAGNTDWGLLPAPASALPRKFNTAHSRPKMQVMFCWKWAATDWRKYSMEVLLFFLPKLIYNKLKSQWGHWVKQFPNLLPVSFSAA